MRTIEGLAYNGNCLATRLGTWQRARPEPTPLEKRVMDATGCTYWELSALSALEILDMAMQAKRECAA